MVQVEGRLQHRRVEYSMKVTAKLKNYRSSARKARLVAGLIRGAKVSEARRLLKFNSKKASTAMLKLVNSAAANAEHNYQVKESENMVVSKVLVNEGVTMKRWNQVSRGRAHPILKRTCHLEVVLEGKD